MKIEREKIIWVGVALLAIVAITARLTTYDIKPAPEYNQSQPTVSTIEDDKNVVEENETNTEEDLASANQELMIWKTYEAEELLAVRIPNQIETLKENEVDETVINRIIADADIITDRFYSLDDAYMSEEMSETEIIDELDDIIDKANVIVRVMEEM